MIKIEKVEKLVANFHDNTEYVIHMWNLKQALNDRLVLKKVHKVIKFIQKVDRTIYWCGYWFKKDSLKVFKNAFLVDEWFTFWENYGECLKT